MSVKYHSAALAVLVAGCGRIDFDALPLQSDASNTESIDAAGPGPCSDALLCSSFEDPALPQWQQLLATGGGEMVVSDTQAFRGNRSLKVQVFQSGDTAVAGYQFATAYTSGELWVRGWIFIPEAYGPDSLSALLYLSEQAAPFQYMDATLTTTTGHIFRERSTTGSDILEFAPVAMSEAWHCFEWNVELAPTGHVDLYVDSNRIVGSGEQNMETQGGGFSYLYLGQTDPLNLVPGSAVFIDEVVISRERLGCDFDVPATL